MLNYIIFRIRWPQIQLVLKSINLDASKISITPIKPRELSKRTKIVETLRNQSETLLVNIFRLNYFSTLLIILKLGT